MSEDRRKRKWVEKTESEVPAKSLRKDKAESPISAVKSSSNDPAEMTPAQKAAAAAAKINALLKAKKDFPKPAVPVRKACIPPPPPQPKSPTIPGLEDMYRENDDFIKDIEINDLRNRYVLTKGSTQKQIKDDTGAGTHTYIKPDNLLRFLDVTTRGKYYPDKTLATTADPPLFLHITSTTKTGLEAAVRKVEALIDTALGPLIDERRLRKKEDFERDEFGRRKWPEERVYISLEQIKGFNIRAQVVGPSGQFVKHIQQETKTRVQIKGIGSGFVDPATGQESDEPLYLHITGPDIAEVQRSKQLCEDLVKTVAAQHEAQKTGANIIPAAQFASPPPGYNAPGVAPGTKATVPTGNPFGNFGSNDPYNGAYGTYPQYQQPFCAVLVQLTIAKATDGGNTNQQQYSGSPPPPASNGQGGYNSVPPPPGL
ncbi:hypothetical protein NEOLI_002233 [Neolecta irregularis DAH-3]|uniref:K Homology domain-containing protein n=1 Tax=Neolecta irregularis (strain DAH-3) TaxID=1198029 RepID=A0A1U7LRD5_NEOID|nr:hypothetical protein NEOLI_002233 [Neolecta irregularis DAH-3]|eukprot:OLL25217.1 hypothetical protein NEOLI_002233 [Neolecta irregularis DAH-3]